MSPRVLFVDHTAQLGGAELSLLSLAESFSAMAHVVLFEDGPFRRRLQEAGVGVTVLPAPAALDGVRRGGGGSLASAVRAIPALLRQAWTLAQMTRDYDVLLANSQKAMLVAGLAGLLAHRPVVWSLRDLMTRDHFGSLQIRVAAAAARLLVARVIANSNASRAALVDAGMPAERIGVVYNGIDPASFDAVTDDDVEAVRRELALPERGVVGVFSRLSAWKGQHVVVEALRELPDVTTLFVGEALFPEDEAYAHRLRTDVEAWGLTDRVRMPGFRADIPVLMRACDVVLHTSTAPEPFGRVVVEGMLAGTPVVATREGGPAEIIIDGKTGLLLPAGDPCALTAAIRHLLDDPAFANSLAANGRAAAAQFSPEAMTTQVRTVLDTLTSSPDRPNVSGNGTGIRPSPSVPDAPAALSDSPSPSP